MKKKNKLWCIFTIILAMALLLPCFTLSAFATDVATAAYIPKDKLIRYKGLLTSPKSRLWQKHF